MKTAKLTAILIFLLFAIALPALTYADIAGKITALQGDVDVLKPGMERAAPAALQQPVSEGDIVRTKSTGKAEITFVDESVVRLAPNSRLQITEYLMEGNKRKSGVMNLFRGKMRAVVSKSRGFLAAAFGEGEKFEVRTPTAVAGVRGTDFFVFYQMGISGIVVREGRVDAFNPAIPGQIVRVTDGMATTIAGNTPPSAPRPAADVEMIRYTRDTDVSEKPKEGEGTTTADAGTLPPAGETFGYEAPEGIAPPATNTGAVIETVEIPSSETHPELLSNIVMPPVITVDTIAPTASITPVSASPYTTSTDSTVNINLSSTETSTYSYSLDSGAWTSTPSSLTLTSGEGPHTIAVTATDAAGNTSSPASLSFDLSRYSLTGNAIETTGALTASLLTGEVAGISNQTWGGWNIGMKGTSSMPSPFTLNAGGTSSDATISNNGGYWIEVINGFSDGVSVLSGTSNLKYLSYDRLGTGIGVMTGSYYDFNMWSATDSGTYTETPLAWSGDVTDDNNSNSYYSGAGLYSFDSSSSGWLDIEGNSTGIMGGTSSPWSGTTVVSYMGKYNVSNGIGYGLPYLWTPEINMWGSATNNWSGITTSTGMYQGFIGGVWKGNGTIDAKVYSLYIDPSGNAGILKGDLNGTYYPGLNMFEADGTWTPTALTNGLDAGTATVNVVSTDYGYNITSLGDFIPNNSSSITVAGNEGMFSYTDWRYSIAGQDWGISKSIIGGWYCYGDCSSTPPDTWSLSTFVDLSSQGTIYGTQTDGTQWSNGVLKGTTYGYGADITNTPMTWISVGETIGTFDPVALSWQAVQTGAWLDTNKFLAMTQTAQGQAALTALNIPFAEVGKANLTLKDNTNNPNLTAVNMNNVTFFAYQTGAAPKIWATDSVTGNYSAAPVLNQAVTVSGDGLTAQFAVQQWTGSAWTATVNGSGTLDAGGNTNYYTGPVQMNGAAAGNVDKDLGGKTCSGCFSGTAAGVAK